jgi:hypothetical protein
MQHDLLHHSAYQLPEQGLHFQHQQLSAFLGYTYNKSLKFRRQIILLMMFCERGAVNVGSQAVVLANPLVALTGMAQGSLHGCDRTTVFLLW